MGDTILQIDTADAAEEFEVFVKPADHPEPLMTVTKEQAHSIAESVIEDLAPEQPATAD